MGSVRLTQYPLIPAHPDNYGTGRAAKDIWFVLHCTATPYADDYPASLGRYWQNNVVEVSVHYGVSDTMTRQYVGMDDTAWQAREPGNTRGVGVELAGLPGWTRGQWLAHKPMLQRAATLCREVAHARGYDLSLGRKLTVAELRAYRPGVTSHADLTAAFDGTHTDPGPNFPWDVFFQLLNGSPEVDVPLTGDEINQIKVATAVETLNRLLNLTAYDMVDNDEPVDVSNPPLLTAWRKSFEQSDANVAALAALAVEVAELRARVDQLALNGQVVDPAVVAAAVVDQLRAHPLAPL